MSRHKPRKPGDIVVAGWQPRDPRGLPHLRDELIAVMQNEMWLIATSEALTRGQGTIAPDLANPMRAAQRLALDETDRLRAATLCSVSAPMSKLAVKAGELLPTWELRRDDLPREQDGKTTMTSGLMVFDAPIAEYVTGKPGRQIRVEIVGASWGPTRFGTEDSLWVTFYSARVDNTDYAALAQETGVSEERLREANDDAAASMIWDNEILGTFNHTEVRIAGVPEAIDPADPTTYGAAHTASWLQTVRAAWMMLRPAVDTPGRRPLTEITDVPASSKATRRALREGIHINTNPVRVLQLHHSRRNTAPRWREGKKLDYQQEVAAHLRWQPYPTRGTIELIVIDEYVRGPKDAPFKERQPKPTEVLRLDRPPGGRPPRPDEVQ